MPNDLPEHNYSYDGWLVFNGLFSIESKVDDTSPEQLLSQLQQYTDPDPGERVEGYKRTRFDKELARAGDVTWNLQRFADDLYSFKYKRTRWNNQVGFNQAGNRTTIQTPKHDGIEIFWDDRRDLMAFKGRKSWLGQNRKELRGGLSEKVRLRELNFDFDFFLWVLYQKFIGQGLTTDLSVRKIESAETTEGKDDGVNLRLEGSKNVLRSVQVISSLLQGKKPRALEGHFVLDSDQIEAKIEHGGKIHVKVSDNELQDLDDLRRMGVSLRFIFELVHQYRVWQNLGPKQKYPPTSFFYDLAEVMEDEGFEPVIPMERVPREYEKKREGKLVDDGATRESGRDAT